MAVVFDGPNKTIIVSTDTSFAWYDIYQLARDWEETNIQYHSPLDASVELSFVLRYDWKLKPSGYSANTVVTVTGKIDTYPTAGGSLVLPPTTGSPVTWNFSRPAEAVIVPVGETVNVWHEPPTASEIASQIDLSGVAISGMTTEEHNKLMAIPAEDDGMTTGEFMALK